VTWRKILWLLITSCGWWIVNETLWKTISKAPLSVFANRTVESWVFGFWTLRSVRFSEKPVSDILVGFCTPLRPTHQRCRSSQLLEDVVCFNVKTESHVLGLNFTWWVVRITITIVVIWYVMCCLKQICRKSYWFSPVVVTHRALCDCIIAVGVSFVTFCVCIQMLYGMCHLLNVLHVHARLLWAGF